MGWLSGGFFYFILLSWDGDGFFGGIDRLRVHLGCAVRLGDLLGFGVVLVGNWAGSVEPFFGMGAPNCIGLCYLVWRSSLLVVTCVVVRSDRKDG